MRLTTRIAGFEWLLVALLVATCALSIELIGSSAEKAASIIREDHETDSTSKAMREALSAHEIASARVRLGEGRPQEIYQARVHFSRALERANKLERKGTEQAALDNIETMGERYFNGEVALETPQLAITELEILTDKRVAQDAESTISAGTQGVQLIATFGAIAVLIALFLAARASRRITQPIETLHRTLIALTDPGNSHRRVPDGDYDDTLRELGRAVNRLAERLETAEREPERHRALLVTAAERLIERLQDPVVIVDLSGCTRLSNSSARNLLRVHTPAELGIPDAVRAALAGDSSNGGPVDTTRLLGDDERPVGYALRLSPPKTV